MNSSFSFRWPVNTEKRKQSLHGNNFIRFLERRFLNLLWKKQMSMGLHNGKTHSSDWSVRHDVNFTAGGITSFGSA